MITFLDGLLILGTILMIRGLYILFRQNKPAKKKVKKAKKDARLKEFREIESRLDQYRGNFPTRIIGESIEEELEISLDRYRDKK